VTFGEGEADTSCSSIEQLIRQHRFGQASTTAVHFSGLVTNLAAPGPALLSAATGALRSPEPILSHS
jgi:hypothetical protein